MDRSDLLPVIAAIGGRRRSHNLLESFGEEVAIAEMKCIRDALDAHAACCQQIAGTFDALLLDIAVDVHADFGFEFLGQIVFAVADLFGKIIYAQWFICMRHDVAHTGIDCLRIYRHLPDLIDNEEEIFEGGVTG